MNICGCLIHVAQAQLPAARARMENTDGVEIHAATDDGRLVVVVEDTDEARASEIIMGLHQIPGVISLSLNYHHFEDLSQAAPAAAPVLQPEI
ncbi:chaperone NapD [Donghicola sp. C2-DW-16]|uniref:Chaperone NapD n=1 Tax=Donghicola mangrovi TaxID=2729614 RepID=A0ABX2PLJ0_9RHOB|nr:chaperone NapD [Donghicola mangrovi]NVO29359.1 chaperone NapD [Donghicola mangrovi]